MVLSRNYFKPTILYLQKRTIGSTNRVYRRAKPSLSISSHSKLLITLSLILSFGLNAQYKHKHWISFKNKNGTPYSLTSPLTYLSQAAIDRRAKYNIPIDSSDLPINPAYIAAITKWDSVHLLNRSKWFNAISIELTDSILLDSINALPFVNTTQQVESIKWNGSLEDSLTIAKPSIAYNKFEDSFDRYNYGDAYTQTKMLELPCLHNRGYDGTGITIAVLDAGFSGFENNPAFDSLLADNRLLGYWDFVDGDDTVFAHSSHGMHVLTTMASNLPGKMVGTAPKANYWLLRSEKASTEYVVEEDNWVSAAEFADSVGADIINSSLGYTHFDDPTQNHQYSDMDGNTTRITIGADKAASKGILVVNSAGNSGQSQWYYIGAPADGDSVLTVGAVDKYRQHAEFSSKGPTYDGRIKPNVSTMGQGAIVVSSSGNTFSGNGTSFSSPIMAGAAACLLQANPNTTNMQLINYLQQSASQKDTPDNFYGYGIPNLCMANKLMNGVNETTFTALNLIEVYPTPFIDHFFLSFYSKTSNEYELQLVDVNGKVMFQKLIDANKNSINEVQVNNLQHLSHGTYLLSIRSTLGESRISYKLIK